MNNGVFAFPERGVTLCASQIGISLDFIEALLERMHQLELNTLIWELKIKSPCWELANTWHYYTASQVSQVLALAQRLGIEVVPEVNAPGHMGIWLENYPQYALKRLDGSVDPEGRLDITNPQAIDFYLQIVDEYLRIFPSRWWHMGADEYMIHDSFANYPYLAEYAHRTFCTSASEYDVFNSFVNEVNQFVKGRGRRLRIWNDGIHETSVVHLDNDILIEYWKDEGLRITDFIQRGHDVINNSEVLYWSRSHPPYRVDAPALWESNWDARTFIGNQYLSDVLHGGDRKQRGLRVSIWPDESFRATEHEVWEAIQDSLILVAELGKYGVKRNHDWRTVGMSSLSVPTIADSAVSPGLYEIPELNVVGKGPWRVQCTPDGYRTLEDTSCGKNLTLKYGQKHLGVVTQAGARPSLELPADMSASWPDGWENAESRNTQKWIISSAVLKDNSIPSQTHEVFSIKPALTGQILTHSDEGLAQWPFDSLQGDSAFTFRKVSL
ncbi:family 20 glycosylhydrolase [Mobiluncus sp.]|uniref:family 20 glycosylhydrolase n=1 Tax=Mobiluncus sp. TaxID=47293 RepID=UPI002A909B03|nr:family 20 glycosylhydrolase [Mobiluncus sp.]MDY6076899.1 family 20 glycosylhydrolase [Mobiluncus sp.]